jgi:hypothetical protein
MIFFATLVMGEDLQAAAPSLGCSSPKCLFPRTWKLCPTIGSFVEGDQKGPGKKACSLGANVFAHPLLLICGIRAVLATSGESALGSLSRTLSVKLITGLRGEFAVIGV